MANHIAAAHLQTLPDFANSPRIAIVYDKLTTHYGGAEHVLQALHQAFPAAPLFTTVRDTEKTTWLGEWEVATSFLQKIPLAPQMYKVLSPLMPLALESLDLSEYDVIISVSSDHAKAVLTLPDQLHVCYLLTPTRYLYSHASEYAETEGIMRLPGARVVAAPLLSYLRRFDQISAYRPDVLIPISKRVAERSSEFYGRKTTAPFYPPIPLQPAATEENGVEIKKTAAALQLPQSFVLSASRLVAYKRIDLAITAALRLNQTLAISGVGPAKHLLHATAGPSCINRHSGESLEAVFIRAHAHQKKIIFLGYTSETELHTLFAASRAFLLPGIEDFGIAPLQAAAHGTPSVLHAESGASELLPEPLSAHITSLSTEAVAAALDRLLKNPPQSHRLRAVTKQHSTERFTTQFPKVVYDLFIQKLQTQTTYTHS